MDPSPFASTSSSVGGVIACDGAGGPGDAVRVAAGRPADELAPEDEPGLARACEARCAVGRVGHAVQAPLAAVEPLRVEADVDRVGARLADDREEAVVVLPPAERAGPVAGGEGGRLVEEEELGELARPQSVERCQPLNSRRQPIQRRVAWRRRIRPSASCRQPRLP